MSPILPIHSIPVPEIARVAVAPAPDTGSFQDLLQGSIGKVEQVKNDAAAAVDRFLTGDGEELHTVAIAGQRAELSMELFLQVRNKVVSAYQEIMRMQM